MLFHSLTYILFLAITILLYRGLSQRFRIWLLLAASYMFYMSWSPPFGLIYGPVIFLDSLYFYGLAKAMGRWPQYKKKILVFGITTELLLLAFFKYANFLVGSVESLTRLLHLPAFHVEFHIFLPLAISFTNFILISYLVDVYRGEEKPDYPFTKFATYVAFFPHLIAGPIVRAKELLHQFDKNPPFEWEPFLRGVHKFIQGLAIKVLIADMLAGYVEQVYATPALQGFDSNWVATYAFAIQIFCDFAGYTMMAQGSALMLGYTLPENFNAPYFAQNISDFWRRWHMSLSRWLRDYLYIPLGGSRGSKWQTYRNLFITMGLGGLWHGANWTFVIWGLYQGLLLSLHKGAVHLKLNRWIAPAMAVLLTFHAVCIGWVFFRAPTFSQAWQMLGQMLNPVSSTGLPYGGWETLLYCLAFFFGYRCIRIFSQKWTSPWAVATVQGSAYFFLAYVGILYRFPHQEFIYFQF